MLDVSPQELLLVLIVALLVIGPKDLPRVMRTVGHWVGKAKGTVRHFRSGIDAMIRESELQEMEKKWRAENERILQDYPMPAPDSADAIDEDPDPDNADIGAPELPLGNPADPPEPKPELP